MAFTVARTIRPAGDAIYYRPDFRSHVESYLNILRVANPRVVVVQADVVHQFEGNFFGYLASIGVEAQYHWITLRTNGFHNPNEFGRKHPLRNPNNGTVEVMIPNDDLLENIRVLYLSKQN